ncbi:uncharacterized protein LOC144951915 [Lampetra fluviatilis]
MATAASLWRQNVEVNLLLATNQARREGRTFTTDILVWSSVALKNIVARTASTFNEFFSSPPAHDREHLKRRNHRYTRSPPGREMKAVEEVDEIEEVEEAEEAVEEVDEEAEEAREVEVVDEAPRGGGGRRGRHGRG